MALIPRTGSASRATARAASAFLALVLPLASGCRTYATKTDAVRQAWGAGQVDQAVAEFNERVRKSGEGRDGVIWRLEQATALRAAGKYDESNRAFERAEARMAEYANAAKVRVATEAMATMTTPANLPYEGRCYDKIMAATYRALNCLALDRPEDARPALFRAYQYQQDAVAENARRIERAKEDAAKGSQAGAVQRTEDNRQFQQQVGSLYATHATMRPYAEYVNPFSVWLDGIYFLAQAQDFSDLERSKKSLERTLAFAPDNPFVRADLDAVDRRLKGGSPEPVIYVIYEAGRAPIRRQVRIDIPIVIANVSYVGSSWPVLEPQNGSPRPLAVSAGSQSVNTAIVASLDSVIARDFEDEKPAIITRTLISTLAKGAAAFAANEAASQQDEALGALVRIATLAYQASVNIADTRTWTTLPKEFQVARFSTPPDRTLILGAGSQQPTRIDVGEGLARIVYVRSVGENLPLLVSQMRLK